MFICIRKRQILTALLAALLLLLGALLLSDFLHQPAAQTMQTHRFPAETFIIDAGHGGEDGGAVSGSGVQESAVNLAIAQRLDALMGFYGFNTVMTRTEDISLHDSTAETLRQKKSSDLKNRVAMVNETENATLISIHQNAFPQTQYRGAQVFYCNDEASKLLAQEIQNRVQTFLDPSNERQPQRVAEGVYLMNHVDCRAVLVECGFLSNTTDEQRLQDVSYQQKIAATITAACLRGG